MQEVIIFGTAQRGKEILDILTQLPQYEVVAFSCNNPMEWGREKESVEVIPPRDMIIRYPDAIVVIASVAYAEIERELSNNHLIPHGGCFHVYQIISSLSDEEHSVMSAKVKRETAFYDLDWKAFDIPPESGGCERYLVICYGGYPTESNPRCVFVHERVLEYFKAGLKVDAFGLIEDARFEQYEFQGVRVFQGGAKELTKFLQGRNYKKILIHFVSANIVHAIEQAGKADTPMIVWCHGYEVMPWYRCWFNFTQEEIQQDKAFFNYRDAEKKSFLRDIYGRENIKFVFVSEWQMERSKKFVGMLPKNCRVIHNFINTDFFASSTRTAEDRLHILSIKSHSSRTYANDLTAKAILELSGRGYFPQLTFELYGDGILFDENFGELMRRNFPNVQIHREILSHEQIRALYQRNGIFFSPTRMDSHQVTASEAMATGMCVVTTNAGPMREFIDETCGSISEFDNYFMMAEDIEFLYFHPEEFLLKAENAAIRAKKECGYGNTIQKELHLILDDSELTDE